MNVPATTQPKQLMPVSSVFADAEVDDLGEGIRAALAQLSINQNIFSIRVRGGYTDMPPDQLRQTEVVILRGAKTQSKTFWEGGYTPGSNRNPDCWSSNSLTPDPQVPVPQNNSCTTCKNNVFVTGQNGLKKKLCSDHKRLAIVPAGDVVNEALGGAMIFRCPAGSLGHLDTYAKELKGYGIPYYAYTTWLSLVIDPTKDTTKVQFSSGRPLTDEEAIIIKEMRDDERAMMIVNEALAGFESDPVEEQQPAQPPQAAAPIQAAPQPRPPQAAPPIQQQSRPPQAAPPVQQRQPTPGVIPGGRPVVPGSGASPIGTAVAAPAAPPPTQRVVQQAPQEEVATPAEEAAQQGAAPSEIDDMFGSLMNQQ